jgi:hypothetical protein
MNCYLTDNENALIKSAEARKADKAWNLRRRLASPASHGTFGRGQGWSQRWVSTNLKTPSCWSASHCLGCPVYGVPKPPGRICASFDGFTPWDFCHPCVLVPILCENIIHPNWESFPTHLPTCPILAFCPLSLHISGTAAHTGTHPRLKSKHLTREF